MNEEEIRISQLERRNMIQKTVLLTGKKTKRDTERGVDDPEHELDYEKLTDPRLVTYRAENFTFGEGTANFAHQKELKNKLNNPKGDHEPNSNSNEEGENSNRPSREFLSAPRYGAN